MTKRDAGLSIRAAARREQIRFIWALVLVTGGVRTAIELLIYVLHPDYAGSLVTQVTTVWPVALVVGYVGARMFARLAQRLERQEAERLEALARVEYLEARNAILHTVASAADVAEAFRIFARYVGVIVPCDRVALALLAEDQEEFRTISQVVGQDASDETGGTDAHFRRLGSLLGEVVEAREPRIVDELAAIAPRFLDAHVAVTSGLHSAIVLPLTYGGRPLGALNVAARRAAAFTAANLIALRPIAEMFAVACAAQKLGAAVVGTEGARQLAARTFAATTEVNSSIQAIAGRCELLVREYSDPALLRDVNEMRAQARRASELLREIRRLAGEQAASGDQR